MTLILKSDGTLNAGAIANARKISILDAAVVSHRDSIIANGGTIQDDDVIALNSFIQGSIIDGDWNRYAEIYPLAGDQLAAARVALKRLDGKPPSLNMSGTYARSLGLLTNSSVSTGLFPSELPDWQQAGAIVVRDAATRGDYEYDLWADSFYLNYQAGDSKLFNSRVTFPDQNAGIYISSLNTIGGNFNSHRVYRNGALLASGSQGPNPDSVSQTEQFRFPAFAGDARNIRFLAILQASVNDAAAARMSARLQALMSALGRAF